MTHALNGDESICPACRSALTPGPLGEHCPLCLLRLSVAAVGPGVDGAPATLDDYELLGEIARGGMGVVYRARQHTLNRIVALKVLIAGEYASADARQRFRREAETIARLQHPAIVAIHNVGESDGLPWLAMDLIEGKNLSELVREQPLPGRQAAEIVRGVAEAVQHAHERGVLHRDLKPSNILVGHNGQPHVTDFGLARRFDHEVTITRSGQMLGSPGCVAPEQAFGEDDSVGPTTDVYGLGALLYHLLTGRPPFQAATFEAILLQLRENDPVRPRRLNPSAPQDLEVICLKCLQKKPAYRYLTAGEVAEELGRFLRGESIRARPAPIAEKGWRWCRRRPALTALLAVLAAGAGLAVWQIDAARRAQGRERQRAEGISTRLQETNTRLNETVDLVELQRAEDLFRAGDSAEALSLLLRVLERNPSHPIATPRLALALLHGDYALPIGSPFAVGGRVSHLEMMNDNKTLFIATPDGPSGLWDAVTGQLRIAFESAGKSLALAMLTEDQKLAVGMRLGGTGTLWDVATGRLAAPEIRPGPKGQWIWFSPDGARAATGSSDGTVQFWNARTGQRVGPPLRHDGEVAPLAKAFSADGQRFAVGASGIVRVWNAVRQEHLFDLPPVHPRVNRLAFSPDGRWLFAASAGDFAVHRFSAETGEPLLPPLRHEAKINFLRLRSDSRLVITGSNDGTARYWDAATGEALGRPLRHRDWVSSGSISADTRLVVTTSGDKTARLWDYTGRPVSQPLPHGEQPYAAAFSRDGKMLYTVGAERIVRRWDLRRLAEKANVTNHEGVHDAEFSGDGKFLVTASRDGSAKLWRANTYPFTFIWSNGTHRAQPAVARFSRDSRRFALAAGGAVTVRSVEAPGEVIASLESDQPVLDLSFSPDGALLAIASQDKTARVWHLADNKPAGPVLQHTNPVKHVRFSPDGKRLFTVQQSGSRVGVRAQLWDLATGRRIGNAIDESGDLATADLSPDARLIVTGSNNDEARVWNATSGSSISPPLPHGRTVHVVAFSTDNRFVATGSWDRTARIWDARTGEPVAPALPHDDHVIALCFSADGHRLATGSKDKTARLWDIATGLPLTEPLRHPSAVRVVRFSANGQRLLTVSEGGAARVWEVPDLPSQAPTWLIKAAHALAAERTVGPFQDANVFTEFEQARAMAERDPGAGHYAQFARWFFPATQE